MRRHLIATTMAVVLTLFAAACGDDGDGPVVQSGDSPETTTTGPTDDEAGAFPVTVAGDAGEVTLAERPEAIVSLSPTGTEMLFAIGAGDQVVAVDEHSYFPPEAPVTDLSGFQPNIEAIAAYEPDLVLISYDPGDVIDALGELDVPVLLLDAALDLDGTYTQLEVLGAATGNVGGAAEVVASMQAELDEIVANLPEVDEPLTYFHELDDMLYTVTSDTFIGQMYERLGLVSIADEVEGAAESGGYPQLSAEFVVDADPDIIFLADAECCGQSRETVAARPGWDQISAVRAGNVVVVDGDVASRWGPRTVDLLREVADHVTAAVPAP